MSEATERLEHNPAHSQKGLRGIFASFQRPRSLGSKLAQWNALVLLIMLALLEIIVYQLVINSVISSLDGKLGEQGSKLEVMTRQRQFTGQPSDSIFLHQLVNSTPSSEFTTTSLYIKLYDPHTGHLLAISPYLQQVLLPLSQVDFQAAVQGQHVLRSLSDRDGNEVHALVLPLFDKTNRLVAIAQLSQSLQFVKQLQVILILVLTIGGLLAAIVAYIASLLFTHHELRPLRRLITTMHELSVQRLGELRFQPRIITTEVILLTEAFNSMLDRLQASFALQHNFITNISHEMRTPLTAIQGQIEVMLIDPELNDGMRQYLQDIRVELRRVSRLVNNLLTSARAEAGLLPQPFAQGGQPVELDALVVEVAREARFLHQQREQAHAEPLIIGKLEQIRVPGDPDLLKQLLLNLVDNALTYTPPSGQVTLSLIRSDRATAPLHLEFPTRGRDQSGILSGGQATYAPPTSGGQQGEKVWAILSVCDTGPGIDPADLPHIFERHYRSSRARTASKSGAGLGLFIARLIAEAHGGSITLDSELEKGTCFHAWLPVAGETSE